MGDPVTLGDLLSGAPDLDRVGKALQAAGKTGLSDAQEVALSATAWAESAQEKNGILAVFQFPRTRDRLGRLVSDLETVGAAKAAALTAELRAQIKCEDRQMAKHLPLMLEGSDRLFDASRAMAPARDAALDQLRTALWAYMNDNREAFAGLPLPKPKKGLFGRLFG